MTKKMGTTRVSLNKHAARKGIDASNIFILGLAGPDTVGKTGVKKVLGKAYGLVNGFHLRSFAKPMYTMMATLLPWAHPDIFLRKDEPMTRKTAPLPCLVGLYPRDMLRGLGDWGRSRHTNFWLEHAEEALSQDFDRVHRTQKKEPMLFIYDDVRHTNEAGFCDAVLELQRPGKKYSKKHSSDCGLPKESITSTWNMPPISDITPEVVVGVAKNIPGLGEFLKRMPQLGFELEPHDIKPIKGAVPMKPAEFDRLLKDTEKRR